MNKKGIVNIIIILVAIIILIIFFLAISIKSSLNKCALPREPLEKVSYSFECIKELLIFKIIVYIIVVVILVIAAIIIIKFILKKYRGH